MKEKRVVKVNQVEKKRASEWRLRLEGRFETGRNKRLISGWLHRGVCQRIKERDESLAGEESCWTSAAVRLCMAIMRVFLLYIRWACNSRGIRMTWFGGEWQDEKREARQTDAFAGGSWNFSRYQSKDRLHLISLTRWALRNAVGSRCRRKKE